jgi:hypothetical protein
MGRGSPRRCAPRNDRQKDDPVWAGPPWGFRFSRSGLRGLHVLAGYGLREAAQESGGPRWRLARVGDGDAAGADAGGDFDVFGPVDGEDVGAVGVSGGG